MPLLFVKEKTTPYLNNIIKPRGLHYPKGGFLRKICKIGSICPYNHPACMPKKPTCFFHHKMLYYPHSGDIAHLVERLVRNQQVVGSSPIISIINQHSLTKREFFYFKAIDVNKNGLEAERTPTRGRKRRQGCRRQ